jgi:chemotaxis family two-component system response regulator PixG
MTTPIKRLQILSQELDKISKKMTGGELILNSHAKEAKLHLFYGRLLFATAEFHRVWRWQRAIKQYCPNWQPKAIAPLSPNQPWEYQLLYQGVSKKQIGLNEAKGIIRRVAFEILFCLSRYPDLSYEWQPKEATDGSELSLGLSLSYRELEPVIAKVAQLVSQWQAAGLDTLSPSLVAVAKKPVSPDSFSGIGQYLNGQYDLWDLASNLQKSITSVTRGLMPLISRGIVQLKTMPDLPAPDFLEAKAKQQESQATETAKGKRGLIACIDDSQAIAQTLRNIVEPAGYQFIHTADPVRGLAQLAQHKPDLIFLDIEMPNASGYTVCQFLRKAPAFKHTPVIMLTSRDNLVDRSRAKLVGASEFIAKPPEGEQVLQIIEKYSKPLTISN